MRRQAGSRISPDGAMQRLFTVMLGFVWLVVGASVPAGAHEGHKHGSSPPVSASDPNLGSRSAASARYEVTLKYTSVAEQGRIPFRIYLSDFSTNAPEAGATVTLNTTFPEKLRAEAPQLEAGIYGGVLEVEASGRYAAILSVEHAGVRSEFALTDLPLGESAVVAKTQITSPTVPSPFWVIAGIVLLALLGLLVRWRAQRSRRLGAAGLMVLMGASLCVQGTAADDDKAHEGSSGKGAPIGVAVPRYVSKESQFLLGVRTVPASKDRVFGQLTAMGRVTHESGALAAVSAPQTGRLDVAGPLVTVGERVHRGQILAYLLTIDRLPIRAPIAGLVAEANFADGQWVQAGQELARILDERRSRVEVPLYGEDLSRALRARAATVRSAALPDRSFPARLVGLAPLANPSGASASDGVRSSVPPILLAVKNDGGLLRPGMIVEVGLQMPEARELITVPEVAILYQESGPAVFVHTAAEAFELRSVAIAGRYENRVGITGDVRVGDRVVTEGAYSMIAAPAATLSPGPATAQPGARP